MIPISEFLTALKPVHSSCKTGQPWRFLAWGLQQLGLVDQFTGAGNLPEGRFVILPNVEVCCSYVLWETNIHLPYRKLQARS